MVAFLMVEEALDKFGFSRWWSLRNQSLAHPGVAASFRLHFRDLMDDKKNTKKSAVRGFEPEFLKRRLGKAEGGRCKRNKT